MGLGHKVKIIPPSYVNPLYFNNLEQFLQIDGSPPEISMGRFRWPIPTNTDLLQGPPICESLGNLGRAPRIQRR